MDSLGKLGEKSPQRDKSYPLIVEAVAVILGAGDVVRPVDVLVHLEVITPDQIDQWRKGGLPYLERGMTAGLSRVAKILRVLREHALEIGLSPVPGKYTRKGKWRLRFSKSGETASEEAYSYHFVRNRPAGPDRGMR